MSWVHQWLRALKGKHKPMARLKSRKPQLRKRRIPKATKKMIRMVMKRGTWTSTNVFTRVNAIMKRNTRSIWLTPKNFTSSLPGLIVRKIGRPRRRRRQKKNKAKPKKNSNRGFKHKSHSSAVHKRITAFSSRKLLTCTEMTFPTPNRTMKY